MTHWRSYASNNNIIHYICVTAGAEHHQEGAGVWERYANTTQLNYETYKNATNAMYKNTAMYTNVTQLEYEIYEIYKMYEMYEIYERYEEVWDRWKVSESVRFSQWSQNPAIKPEICLPGVTAETVWQQKHRGAYIGSSTLRKIEQHLIPTSFSSDTFDSWWPCSAETLPVTPNGLHPRWLDLWQSQLFRPPSHDCSWHVRTGGYQLSTIQVQWQSEWRVVSHQRYKCENDLCGQWPV